VISFASWKSLCCGSLWWLVLLPELMKGPKVYAVVISFASWTHERPRNLCCGRLMISFIPELMKGPKVYAVVISFASWTHERPRNLCCGRLGWLGKYSGPQAQLTELPQQQQLRQRREIDRIRPGIFPLGTYRPPIRSTHLMGTHLHNKTLHSAHCTGQFFRQSPRKKEGGVWFLCLEGCTVKIDT
jgi:hypothetical protein